MKKILTYLLTYHPTNILLCSSIIFLFILLIFLLPFSSSKKPEMEKVKKETKSLSGNYFILEKQPNNLDKYQFTFILENGNFHIEMILSKYDIEKINEIIQYNLKKRR